MSLSWKLQCEWLLVFAHLTFKIQNVGFVMKIDFLLTWVFIFGLTLFFACNTKNEKQGGKGEELVRQYKCLQCHHVEEPITGPSFRAIAERYANAGDTIHHYLSQKIIKGGTGVWGQIYMIPHPSVSKEEARQLTEYILSLK
jgi:cytochrome c551/c552